MHPLRFFLGLDLGQSVDYSAMVLVERVEKIGEWDAVWLQHKKSAALRLRYLERVPRGTSYPDVVRRVAEVVQRREVAGQCQVVVDGTGVGQAVVDMFEQAGLGCPLWKVKITSGDAERHADGYYRVPKRDLLARVQVLFQQGGLEIAKGIPQGESLLREMSEMRVKVLPSGYEQFAAGREGEHDDLVLALAMACWGAEKVYGSGRSEFYGRGRIV